VTRLHVLYHQKSSPQQYLHQGSDSLINILNTRPKVSKSQASGECLLGSCKLYRNPCSSIRAHACWMGLVEVLKCNRPRRDADTLVRETPAWIGQLRGRRASSIIPIWLVLACHPSCSCIHIHHDSSFQTSGAGSSHHLALHFFRYEEMKRTLLLTSPEYNVDRSDIGRLGSTVEYHFPSRCLLYYLCKISCA